MDIEAKIQELLALAEPLRALDEDDPAKAPLAGIVDEINRLRELQGKAALAEALSELQRTPEEQPKPERRKPGPKPKKTEGDAQ